MLVVDIIQHVPRGAWSCITPHIPNTPLGHLSARLLAPQAQKEAPAALSTLAAATTSRQIGDVRIP